MQQKVAFVLGGGGSRGAMQVGALRALLEDGYTPQLITGTSIGSVNGIFIAKYGYSPQGIEKLIQLWEGLAGENFLSLSKWWDTARSLLLHSEGVSKDRIREFALMYGLTRDLRFKELTDIPLFIVGADMNSGCPVVYGENKEESVLDSMMVSIALPPWMAPFEQDGRYLVDGGFVSNLPIEAALNQGATEIIALDLYDPMEKDLVLPRVPAWITKLNRIVVDRQLQLELKLAEAHGVPVKHIRLASDPPVAFWDFRKSLELIDHGYWLARREIKNWPPKPKPSWWSQSHIKTKLDEIFDTPK